MRKKILQPYTLNGISLVETAVWNQVGAGNPKAVPLPGETGVWMLTQLSNESRDTSGLITPSVETTEHILVDDIGNQSVIDVPVSVDMAEQYWDYYNLPLKPGVVLT